MTNRGNDLHQKGLRHMYTKKTENQRDKFNNKRAGWNPRGVTTSVMDKEIPP